MTRSKEAQAVERAIAESNRPEDDEEEQEGLTAADMADREGIRLTPMQAKFVDRYMLHQNAGLAAQEAGYGVGAHRKKVGSRIKNNPNVQTALRHAYIERRKRYHVDEAVVYDLLMETYWNATNVNNHNAAVRALEMIGKSFGMFMDVQVNAEKKYVEVNDMTLAQKVAPIFEKLGMSSPGANGAGTDMQKLVGLMRERQGVEIEMIEAKVVEDK